MEKKIVYCIDKECQEDWDETNPKCSCGNVNYKEKCKNYRGDKEKTNELEEHSDKEEIVDLPWHSNAMGEYDLAYINSKKQPFMVGIIGSTDAGKTTLLAALYMFFRNGTSIGQYKFAGSYTLLGWEKIAHFLGFYDDKRVYFPPHTSSNSNRLPGLLHLLLKDKNGYYQDILFTDAPGEWFKNWAKSAKTYESTGARWIDEYADAFVIIADTVAFEESTGKARKELLGIIERMKNTHNNRPTVLAWTKADQKIEAEIKSTISEQIKANLPTIKVFDTAVVNIDDATEYLRDNIIHLFDYIFTQNNLKRNKKPEIVVQDRNDFFFSIRLDNYAK